MLYRNAVGSYMRMMRFPLVTHLDTYEGKLRVGNFSGLVTLPTHPPTKKADWPKDAIYSAGLGFGRAYTFYGSDVFRKEAPTRTLMGVPTMDLDGKREPSDDGTAVHAHGIKGGKDMALLFRMLDECETGKDLERCLETGEDLESKGETSGGGKAGHLRGVNGYKDVTLLFRLLDEYLRTAEQLSKRYLMRGTRHDRERAQRLIGTSLLATYVEGTALLAMFPEIRDDNEQQRIDRGLIDAVAGWRHSYGALSHVRGILSGQLNPLGLPDDMLVLFQSDVRGESEAAFFHSYDFINHHLTESSGSPLRRALDDLKDADSESRNYHDRMDALESQFESRRELYNERIHALVGWPGESGASAEQPNEGGAIGAQNLRIDGARMRIRGNEIAMENLLESIRIAIEAWGAKKQISNAMAHVYVEYGANKLV